jgi:AraC family transcriptional regulator
MSNRRHLMVQENPDGWIISPASPLLELPLPQFIDGVSARRMGQWDFRERVYERFLPGRLQAVSLLLAAPNTELRFDGRVVMKGPSPIGSFAIPPGTRISGCHTGAQDFVQFLFEPHGMAAVLEDMAIDPHAFELRPNHIPADAALLALSQRLAACCEMLPLLDTLFLETLLQSCLNQMIRRHATNAQRRVIRGESLSPAALRKVMDFIEETIAGQIHLQDLARVAGVSRAHFARAFRNEIGVTPHAYLLQRRLERALHLLHWSRMPIRDVAMATGFSDHAHMTRTFRRHLGASPRDIRH